LFDNSRPLIVGSLLLTAALYVASGGTVVVLLLPIVAPGVILSGG
jgi:hypothetical protein